MRDEYIKWLYETRTINNGDMLVSLLEITEIQQEFIDELGLDEDIEL